MAVWDPAWVRYLTYLWSKEAGFPMQHLDIAVRLKNAIM